MADKKISDLTAASSVANGDLFLIETSGGNSRKATGQVVADMARSLASRSINIGAMRPLSDFTTVNSSGTHTVSEVSGKAIQCIDTAPDATVRMLGIRRAMPSTTSRVAIFIQPSLVIRRYYGPLFGFSDGTKYHVFALFNGVDTAGTGNLEQQTWSNSTTRVTPTALANTLGPSHFGTGYWLGLRVSNSAGKAYWELSGDGVNFATFFAQTMSSGYLGSSGYTNAFCGLFSQNTDAGGSDYPICNSILDWDENGLSRSFA